ncbi:MAG: Fic family protein [Gordonia sp. (in: high G+C Gram-positive bacteria)]|uniref:Fic family protein n=1 Tax=Gordonia sp. (in: high G+C Gram-positive bacteria) TaxID=84139 RepID=UPI0039E4C80A
MAGIAMAGLQKRDVTAAEFDRAHMQSIHRAIFEKVYDWAGEPRVGPTFPKVMTKAGPSPESIARGDYRADDGHPYSYFPAGEEMLKHFDRWARILGRNLTALEPDSSVERFAEAIAEPWGEMNVAHLFREGNTRTQLVFFKQLAQRHGFSTTIAPLAHDADLRARFNCGRFVIQAAGPTELFESVIRDLTRRR